MARNTAGAGMVVIAGVVAGLIFAAFEMMMAALMMGPQAFFMPLRMIGAIALGEAALDPSYSLIAAGTAGVMVHMVLSVAFAFAIAAAVRPLDSMPAVALTGIGLGIALWVVNFYAIAPLMGWTWFPERTNTLVQFVAHAFFFGLPVAWYLGSQRTAAVRA